ncbi:MAG: type VII secretion protein EssC, partial [Ruminococcus sp.]|nr:type VII secretion protein EssC [Ruminococcus sp.]
MVFMVFYNDILKEFVFRENDNSKFWLYIDRNQFNITKSFYIDFEKNNGKWSIHSNTNAYEIHHGGKSLSNFEFNDTNVITIKTINNEKISIISIKKHTDIIEYRKYIFKKEITVGNDCDCDIKYGFGKLVSGHHCTIREYCGNYYVDDCSRNGVFVNTKKINGSYCLKFGDCIDVFGLKILFFNNIIAVGSQIEDYITSRRMEKYEVNNSFSKRNLIQKSSYNYFSPSPRCMYPLFRDKIKIDEPEAPQFSRNKTLLEVIGPSLTMAIPMVIGCVLMGIGSSYSGGGSGLFMISGMVIAVLSAIFGAVWAFYNFNQTKKNEADDEFRRFDAYSNYLVKTADYIREKYSQNQNNLNLLYPSSDDCCNYKEDSYQLWSRNTLHEDFLFCRLGIGDMDFQSKIEIPEEKFSPVYDQLKDKPKILRENFKTLKNVPLGFDVMKHKLVGIVSGRHKRGANTIVNNIIVQLASNIDYTKLKIVFCFDEDKLSDKEQWNYVKILPHIWSEDKQIRYFASNKGEVSDVLYEFADIIRNRSELESMDNNIVLPYYVLFLSDISLLDGELISKYVFDNKQNYGFTTFIITDSFQKLPNKCDYIIQNDRDFNGIYSIYDVSQNHQRIKYDVVYLSRLYSFAKELSNIKVKEIGSSNKIPDSLEFFEMYNIKTVDELDVLSRWKENKTWMSIRAVIGQKTGSDRCCLDLHEKYHGPHGLIAGTTGSGKSELIQTIILSLAINYSPDDIVFFVIDFKGGGMANLFAELPHLSGQISNLSGNQIQRGMISIKSENKRRQRLFNEYGVNNINSYSRLYKNGEASIPVPHLVIIVDEFAELKREEPDFMQELISVAQVGRSLGVHLILATQKPNGTVDDNIWSNSKFRLCLRVQDRQDSNDMIHRPDAAYLTQAGRCYMQVGNDEIFEQFQSGWSGAVYKNNTFEDDDIATMITNTGRTVIDGNKAKFRSRDLEQLEWTRKIFKKIVDNAIIINEAVKKGENDFTSSAEKIISDLICDGEPIGKSTSEIALMSNFIRLVYSGCKTPEEVIKVASEKNIKLPECKEVTQLQAVVKHISKVASENKYKNTTKLWLPLLKNRIELSSLENFEINFNGETWAKDNYNELSVVVGKYDDPQNQSQKSFEINLSTSGHIAICGSVVTGKST